MCWWDFSGRSYEVQVWADPAFLGARVLIGKGGSGMRRRERRFLFVEKRV